MGEALLIIFAVSAAVLIYALAVSQSLTVINIAYWSGMISFYVLFFNQIREW